ncbi:metallophosphoesterase [Clostridium amazonitimonense]|uniref:metallophosphoesterase n=1 Tax=Clostridium amazonitimonense TaxID=1499689 RepID=UPI000509E3F2|nr:metallophosphoesterase [Clostridium amazonitimonense]
MLIGIISDTHREYEVLNKIIDRIKKCDYILHLGDNIQDVIYIKDRVSKKDIKFINVKGNCDYSNSIPDERVVEIGEHRIYMTHGHKYAVKTDLNRLMYRAEELECNIVLYGHTHMVFISEDYGKYIINPGSPSQPRDGKAGMVFVNIEGAKVNPYFMEL